MTKAELIAALERFPDDMEIRLGVPDCEAEYEVGGVQKWDGHIFIEHGNFITWGDDL